MRGHGGLYSGIQEQVAIKEIKIKRILADRYKVIYEVNFQIILALR